MQFGKEAQMSVYSENTDLLPLIHQRIKSFVKKEGGPELCINCSHYYLNVSLAGVDKGQAIKWLLDELQLDEQQAAGIGDTVGDLPLRENVGFFACPGNAHPTIQEIADYVSPYPALDGLLDILQQPAFRVM
jgi:hydroxymethylpyrimidine pyrophosphatase-like HAD family hydrolase